MSDVGVHVTITLNASPLLIDVMMSIVDLLSDPPGSKEPQPSTELEMSMKVQHELKNNNKNFIIEIPEFCPEFKYLLHIHPQLSYGEIENGSLCIRYLSGVIYTTWDEVETAYNVLCIDGLKPAIRGMSEYKQTALNLFIRAMGAGLRRKVYSDHEDFNDPDADFRSVLESFVEG